jgi:plasmid maintenance system antidote protein VapI
MEEMNLKQVDLVDAIGGKSRVSGILNRKRKLTVDMIRKLNRRLNLSPGLLINDYQLTRQKIRLDNCAMTMKGVLLNLNGLYINGLNLQNMNFRNG